MARRTVDEFAVAGVPRRECVVAAQLLHQTLGSQIRIPTFVTLGYVDSPRARLYEFSVEDVRRRITAAPTAAGLPSLAVHAWLTLPTFDVLDTAMIPAIRSVNRSIPFADDIILDHPSRWDSGFVYHPVVVGLPVLAALAGAVGAPLASGPPPGGPAPGGLTRGR